ncbi:MAG TPA: hypothetical protein VFD58_26710 [Blastocatellia bacterium]|nr:hypothetical protein [Blastocatellia bacterium]
MKIFQKATIMPSADGNRGVDFAPFIYSQPESTLHFSEFFRISPNFWSSRIRRVAILQLSLISGVSF